MTADNSWKTASEMRVGKSWQRHVRSMFFFSSSPGKATWRKYWLTKRVRSFLERSVKESALTGYTNTVKGFSKVISK